MRKLLSLSLIGALALSVGCKTINRKPVEEDIPSAEEYLWDEFPDRYEGVIWLIYADPVQEKCRVEYVDILGVNVDPKEDTRKFLERNCEQRLYGK